jgi:hypothetical protein
MRHGAKRVADGSHGHTVCLRDDLYGITPGFLPSHQQQQWSQRMLPIRDSHRDVNGQPGIRTQAVFLDAIASFRIGSNLFNRDKLPLSLKMTWRRE